MGCILKGDVKLDKVFEFTCVPEKPVYNSAEFKIYGCSINSFEYPNIKINKYNNVTIKYKRTDCDYDSIAKIDYSDYLKK